MREQKSLSRKVFLCSATFFILMLLPGCHDLEMAGLGSPEVLLSQESIGTQFVSSSQSQVVRVKYARTTGNTVVVSVHTTNLGHPGAGQLYATYLNASGNWTVVNGSFQVRYIGSHSLWSVIIPQASATFYVSYRDIVNTTWIDNNRGNNYKVGPANSIISAGNPGNIYDGLVGGQISLAEAQIRQGVRDGVNRWLVTGAALRMQQTTAQFFGDPTYVDVYIANTLSQTISLSSSSPAFSAGSGQNILLEPFEVILGSASLPLSSGDIELAFRSQSGLLDNNFANRYLVSSTVIE